MQTSGNELRKTAFVMTPYTERFLKVYDKVLKPAIEESGLIPVIVKDQPFVGPIPEKIDQCIKESVVCIADLTGANPNVMYEVSLAHSYDKPVILITQGKVEKIPFDIRHHRVILYDATAAGLETLAADVTNTLNATLEFGASPTMLLERMLVPSSISSIPGPRVIAASPLSYREAARSRGGWRDRPLGTYSDHIGIRGLMQAFGTIFALDQLPELLDPDDFEDTTLEVPSHLYSIGSPKANWLTGKMMQRFFESRDNKWDFRADPQSKDLRNPKLLLCLNGQEYKPVRRVDKARLVWDFGLVIRGPHPINPNYMLTVMAGRSSRGTEASCLAATNVDCLQKLSKALAEDDVDINEHKQAFCAIVSVCAQKNDEKLGPDINTFWVHEVSVYK